MKECVCRVCLWEIGFYTRVCVLFFSVNTYCFRCLSRFSVCLREWILFARVYKLYILYSINYTYTNIMAWRWLRQNPGIPVGRGWAATVKSTSYWSRGRSLITKAPGPVRPFVLCTVVAIHTRTLFSIDRLSHSSLSFSRSLRKSSRNAENKYGCISVACSTCIN